MGASTIDYVILKDHYMISKYKVLQKVVQNYCPIKFYILNSKLKELSSAEKNIMLMTHHHVPMFIYGKMKKNRIRSISTK